MLPPPCGGHHKVAAFVPVAVQELWLLEGQHQHAHLRGRCVSQREADVIITTNGKSHTLGLVLAIRHGGANDCFADVDLPPGSTRVSLGLRQVLVEHEKLAHAVL